MLVASKKLTKIWIFKFFKYIRFSATIPVIIETNMERKWNMKDFFNRAQEISKDKMKIMWNIF